MLVLVCGLADDRAERQVTQWVWYCTRLWLSSCILCSSLCDILGGMLAVLTELIDNVSAALQCAPSH